MALVEWEARYADILAPHADCEETHETDPSDGRLMIRHECGACHHGLLLGGTFTAWADPRACFMQRVMKLQAINMMATCDSAYHAEALARQESA